MYIKTIATLGALEQQPLRVLPPSQLTRITSTLYNYTDNNDNMVTLATDMRRPLFLFIYDGFHFKLLSTTIIHSRREK